MIIYNITIKVDWDIHSAFTVWVEEVVIESSKTNAIINHSKFLKLLGIDTSDGMTYCIQHYFENQNAYNHYKMVDEMAFKSDLKDKFEDKLVIFTSVLEEV